MINTRFATQLGIDTPIVQAPMGWIARSQLASAVSNAGGLGIIETSSGETDAIARELELMPTLTDRPFGLNLALAFLRDESMVELAIEKGMKFATTSAGSPRKYTERLQEAGIVVYHVVPDLKSAQKAIDAGIDGLVVEGGEGGGFKSHDPVSTMVLLPLIRSHTDLPIIAAGGICDGPSMAAALVLGADGVQMGTRMVSAAESPVHQNWKHAICVADETGTVYMKPTQGPALRALKTSRSTKNEFGTPDLRAVFGNAQELYFGGDMEAAFALSGQIAGRIDSVQPVADIISSMSRECKSILARVAQQVAAE